MRRLVSEIRNQPAHIREIFMWLCVIISFSVISFFWFQSTSKQFVALVNPEKAEAQRIFAENQKKSQPSFLANVGNSFSSLGGGFADLFGFGGSTVEFPNHYQNDVVSPNMFPAAENK